MPSHKKIGSTVAAIAKKSRELQILGLYLSQLRVEWEPEFKFHPTRKWRFDYASPGRMIAIEFEGGVFTGGGHIRGNHYSGDCEKYSEAAILGWKVIRVTAPMVRDGRAFSLIDRAILTA